MRLVDIWWIYSEYGQYKLYGRMDKNGAYIESELGEKHYLKDLM